MSWESSEKYYRIINEEVKYRLGGLHSAACILYSVDFAEIERYQSTGDWESAGKIVGDAAEALERAGASIIVIGTNTMHKVVGHVENRVDLPVIHIADAVAKQIKKSKISTVGFLGTKYTMEQDFYRSRLKSNGTRVIVPKSIDREAINKVIFDELCLGKTLQTSRNYFKKVIKSLIDDGAEGIILGCTEIGLLVKPGDSEVPVFDTTIIHAIEAVSLALER